MRLKDIVGVGLVRLCLGGITQNLIVVRVVLIAAAFVIAVISTTAFHVNKTAVDYPRQSEGCC